MISSTVMFFNLNLFLKRTFDLLFGILLFVLFLPFLLIVSVLILVTSRGPVLFLQKRITLNGKIFTILKFRTMFHEKESKTINLNTYHGDKRITPIGLVLRKFSIDELPQLINIIKGEMSFVGPRPPVLNELGPYDKLPSKIKYRFS